MRVDMPEVSVRVRDGEVTIRTIPPLRSRDLVQYAMILAGEAAARFGTTRGIPLPFATQEPPDYVDFDEGQSQSLSAMFARRRTFRRSQYRSVPAPHSGLGLSAYAQATSPMRRYLDLVVHQQLRAYLANRPLLTAEQILDAWARSRRSSPARGRPNNTRSGTGSWSICCGAPTGAAAGCWSTNARTTARSSSPSSAWSRRSVCPPTCRWTAS